MFQRFEADPLSLCLALGSVSRRLELPSWPAAGRFGAGRTFPTMSKRTPLEFLAFFLVHIVQKCTKNTFQISLNFIILYSIY